MKAKYFALLTLFFSIFINSLLIRSNDCIMIGSNGGGYSGFWYYYGQLEKEYQLDKKIYCFSAGCLAPVSNMQHNNYNFLINMVRDLKKKYNNNQISRFDVRNEFIYKISSKVTDISKYNLNILTANYLGNCKIIKPNTREELIDALNETTSIPFITSRLDSRQNIDGGLCINKYPKCKKNIKMPIKYKFLINIFNPNINEDEDIKYFMNY